MATEKRLIDANALLKAIKSDKVAWRYGVPNTLGLLFDKLRIIIKLQPTVDAVEVVRCKECMWSRPKDHREPTDTPMELICQCAHHHPIPAPWHARMAVSPDGFCSYGERRNE